MRLRIPRVRAAQVRIGCAALAAAFVQACASAPPPPPAAPVGPTTDQKMSWILRLEDQRVLRDPAPPPMPAPVAPPARKGRIVVVPPPPPIPDLATLTTDSEPRMRRRAALAIGRVGLASGVAPLRALLADPDPEVRQMAAFALGLIGDKSASEPLKAALTDASPIVQGRAAEALGTLGDASAAAAIAAMVTRAAQDPAVAAMAPDDEKYPVAPAAEAFRLGAYALVRLKAYDALASAVLDRGGQPVVRWWPVAFALQRIEDSRAAPALMAIAQGPSRYGRAFAIKGLGALKHAPAVAILLPLASNVAADPAIGFEAVRALGRIGDPRAAPALVNVATSMGLPAAIRAEAVDALGGCQAQAHANLVLDLASDGSPLVRAAALRASHQLDPDNFVTVLSGLDPDRHWTVRAALATLLARLNPELAAPRLTAMLADQDLRVIPAVMSALVKVRAPGVEAVLLERLKSDDFAVRASAATLTGELKPPGGAEALVAAYRFGERDPIYVARAAALASLAKYGGAPAMDTLKAALADKDWAVRLRAAELIASLDPASADTMATRPAPIGHDAAFYATPRLIAPTVSPHAYIDTDKGTIEIELAVLDAPLTVENFATLARRGFFNGVGIHRVVPDFVIQGGDARGDGEGGPGYTIRDEFNELPYVRGAVGMALDWHDTGGSQFFITHSPQPHLDGRYTIFGHVVAGMEVVDRIEQWDVIRRVRIWDGNQMTEPRDSARR